MNNPYFLSNSLAGKSVIDIGAHVGSFALQAVSFGANVLAFEPGYEKYVILRENMKMFKSVKCFQLAVGNPGLRQFFGTGTEASLFQDLFDRDFNEWVWTISLKDVLRDETFDLIKLNCEGAEYEIIPEIEKYKDQIKSVIIEFHKERIDPKGYVVSKQIDAGVFQYERS